MSCRNDRDKCYRRLEERWGKDAVKQLKLSRSWLRKITEQWLREHQQDMPMHRRGFIDFLDSEGLLHQVAPDLVAERRKVY